MSFSWTVRSSLLIALTVVLWPAAGRAAAWPPITSEELALTSVAEQPGAPAVILNREETDDDVNHNQRIYVRLKVLTEAGRKYGDIELPYNRQFFGISDVSGRTVHADGTVVPFEGKPFDKTVLKGRNVRVHVKSFSLPDVQVGSILEYRYDLGYGDTSLFSPQWTVQDELFQKRAYFKYVPFQFKGSRYVEIERERVATGVAWTHLLPAGSNPQEHVRPDGFDWVDLEMKNVPAFVEEPYMPPLEPIKWHVDFYYRVELKVDDYWKNEGKYWNKTVEGFLGHRDGIADAVAAAVAADDVPEMKVRKIYSFVQQQENRSYDPPKGQQEQAALRVQGNLGADDVLRQHSGSHDELNRLFVAMVRAAGLPAWLIRVPDRQNTMFDANFLTTNQFDAEIAIVKLGDKELFLDPGSKFCPYGVLNWHYSDNRGLRQSEGKGTEFGTSAPLNYKQALIQRVAHVTLTDKGTAEGTLTIAFFGIEAMDRREQGGKTDDAGRKKLLEDEIKGWLPGGSEVTLSNSPEWNATSGLIAEFKISCPLASSAGRRWIVPLHLFQVNEKPLFSSATRTNTVYFYYPSQEIDEVHITLPPNMAVESLPPDDSFKLDFALYQTTQQRDGAHGIQCLRNLIMAAMVFPVNEYGGLKDFYDKVKADDDQSAVLKGSENAQVK